MTDGPQYDLSGVDGASVFLNLPEGIKVRLVDGALAEITGNPHDGAFLQVRILESSDGADRVGETEYVFFHDVAGVE